MALLPSFYPSSRHRLQLGSLLMAVDQLAALRPLSLDGAQLLQRALQGNPFSCPRQLAQLLPSFYPSSHHRLQLGSLLMTVDQLTALSPLSLDGAQLLQRALQGAPFSRPRQLAQLLPSFNPSSRHRLQLATFSSALSLWLCMVTGLSSSPPPSLINSPSVVRRLPQPVPFLVASWRALAALLFVLSEPGLENPFSTSSPTLCMLYAPPPLLCSVLLIYCWPTPPSLPGFSFLLLLSLCSVRSFFIALGKWEPC
ncbi:hypothetical protein GOP47_0013100 [Adiantum capillus-veneris]|uniref:Uncharacterized protein n=1 Tax=Adiantum capillus-veneris TaxID=13818 RepID=A0A9D4URY0_ADICA|nr:hypothetical protein GOP47_0013100 [Adiantum capillus-veneris]